MLRANLDVLSTLLESLRPDSTPVRRARKKKR
jgi:hypothetical protein